MDENRVKTKIVMLVGGFPNDDNPSRCIFNLRAAEGLAETNDVTVIFARLWRPGRKIIYKKKYDKFILYTVFVPFLFKNKFLGTKIKFFAYFISAMLNKTLRNCDVLHSVSIGMIGLTGAEIAKNLKKKHVLQIIGSDVNAFLPEFKNNRHIRGWEKYVNAISANSEALLTSFNGLYKKNNIKSIVNYRGVNSQLFHPGERPEEFIQILFVGGLPQYMDMLYKDDLKGGRTLMKIFSELDKAIVPPYKLIFAGPEADNEIAKIWHNSLLNKGNVVIAGRLNPPEVIKYMSESQIVVIPSKEEGTPNACFEAMASGCAVLGSNVGGIPELIDDNINGKLLPPNDIQKWVEALKWAIDNRALVQEMGDKAREKVISVFDNKIFFKKLEALYQEII